ncbi:hypothetical protein [Cupriavidus sp. D39]|uniref:hypothetical protein n=1 Tax=Cupriavidus sp. D39 TaxID=2997877 RepID=UPI002270681F|nr:hypothetical protein [Cupriavidus sp. D39]MCY0854055.1 hypothetical protein [Cupriavidus sp. D39]
MRFAKSCGLLIGLILGANAFASTHVFVPVRPDGVKRDATAALNWLRTGSEDDGYVRVVASIDLDAPCLPIGYSGWASTIGQEKIQLAVSLKLSGLSSPLADKEVPIALVDGRDNPGGCIELNAPPITIVPTARLKRFDPAATNSISVEVKARTTSDTELNLVSSAQAGLTLASLFASPVAAASIAGASKLLAEPAIGKAERYMTKKMQGKVPAQASHTFTIRETGQPVTEIVFPVHLGEYGWSTNKGSSEADAIPLIQREKRQSKEDPVFRVKLSFFYTRSLFPLTYKTDGTPIGADIQDSEILAYPSEDGVPSVFQWLSGNNPKEPSLLPLFATAANAQDFRTHCAKALEILDKKGLSLLDRSLALRSFINVARGGTAWYGTPLATACAQGVDASVNNTWLAIFGPGSAPIPPTGGDTMRRPVPGQDGLYDEWLRKSIEPLKNMRTGFRANENQEAYFLKATRNGDLAVIAPKAAGAWPDQPAQPGETLGVSAYR